MPSAPGSFPLFLLRPPKESHSGWHESQRSDARRRGRRTALWPIGGDGLLAVRLRVVQGLGRCQNEGVHSGFKLGRVLEGDVVPALPAQARMAFR